VSAYYNRSCARIAPSQVVWPPPQVPKQSGQLMIHYDRSDHVLYVVKGKARTAEGEDRPGGIVRRHALHDKSPCGLTVID